MMTIFKGYCWLLGLIATLGVVLDAFFKTKKLNAFKMLPEVLALMYGFAFRVGKSGYGPYAEIFDKLETQRVKVALSMIYRKYL